MITTVTMVVSGFIMAVIGFLKKGDIELNWNFLIIFAIGNITIH